MMDEPEVPGPPPDSPVEPLPETPPPPPPPPFPFWGYRDVLLFLGLAVASMAVGEMTVWGVFTLFHLHTQHAVIRLIPGQFVGYLYMFGGLALMFRTQYNQPFWNSIGWKELRLPASSIAGYGILLAFLVILASAPLKTPEGPNPMTKLLEDHTSIILVALFGTTLGPLCEELIFRGFLQPLLVRSLGVAAGILLASVPFGLLHLPEYGWSWQHGLLITLAGAGFGWMRYRTDSTRASTLMHAAYNATFFALLLLQKRHLMHG
jgi:membrane protease YdiL (CAAX protease family)